MPRLTPTLWCWWRGLWASTWGACAVSLPAASGPALGMLDLTLWVGAVSRVHGPRGAGSPAARGSWGATGGRRWQLAGSAGAAGLRMQGAAGGPDDAWLVVLELLTLGSGRLWGVPGGAAWLAVLELLGMGSEDLWGPAGSAGLSSWCWNTAPVVACSGPGVRFLVRVGTVVVLACGQAQWSSCCR